MKGVVKTKDGHTLWPGHNYYLLRKHATWNMIPFTVRYDSFYFEDNAERYASKALAEARLNILNGKTGKGQILTKDNFLLKAGEMYYFVSTPAVGAPYMAPISTVNAGVVYHETEAVERYFSYAAALARYKELNALYNNQKQQQQNDMKSLLIAAFAQINTGAIYSLVPNGKPNSGKYVNDFDDTPKTSMEFICNGLFKVHAVKRQSPDVFTFTLGDAIVTPGGVSTIVSIQLVNDASYFVTKNNRKVLVEEAQIPAPIPAAPPKPAKPAAPVANNGKVLSEAELDALQKKIVATYPRKIRLEKTLKKEVAALGLKGFLTKFFKEWNNEKTTIYADGNKEVQTPVGKRRSIGDILMLCEYYFPDVKIKDVYAIITKDLFKELPGFRSSYCFKIIQKRVWYCDKAKPTEVFDQTQADEHGNTWQKICTGA